jgi:DNA-binding MarR family transcriptional regulator
VPTDTDAQTDPITLAGRLRPVVFRLGRILRQHDDSGLPPATLTALAVIDRAGPLTLGELAAEEQVSPPTITKLVDSLEARGLVERVRDEADRRVCRVRIAPRGRRRLEASRTRRTAWLATQLRDATAEELDHLLAALPLLERLTKTPEREQP